MTPALFQIYYDAATRAEVDQAFQPLDNSANERPDWREYWPIRQFLLHNVLAEDRHYGFFSPRFLSKSDVTAGDVIAFVNQHGATYDVIGFSPYPDQHALFWNVFEQCDWFAPGMAEVCQKLFDEIGCKVDLTELVMDSQNSIFCNYFCARPAFWREWLAVCEKIFALAETGGGPLRQALNTPMDWRPDSKSIDKPGYKVFVIERVVSLILARDTRFKSIAFQPFLRPRTQTPFARFVPQMLMSDALKMAYARCGDPGYKGAFDLIRKAIKVEIGDGRS
jgi:hypothetical protein